MEVQKTCILCYFQKISKENLQLAREWLKQSALKDPEYHLLKMICRFHFFSGKESLLTVLYAVGFRRVYRMQGGKCPPRGKRLRY